MSGDYSTTASISGGHTIEAVITNEDTEAVPGQAGMRITMHMVAADIAGPIRERLKPGVLITTADGTKYKINGTIREAGGIAMTTLGAA